MPKKNIRTPAVRRRERLERLSKWNGNGVGHDFPWTPEIKAEMIEAFRSGSTATELETVPHFPNSVSTLYAEMERDEAFGEAVKRARHTGARSFIDEAADLSRALAEVDEDGNIDLDAIRAAESYARSMNMLAEKLAPADFGPLLKLGADAEAGMPIVQIVSYATQKETQADQTQTGKAQTQ